MIDQSRQDVKDLNPDNLINLLNVYATQFGSYTTLLWQVPALSLTAQSFLLTIALGSTTTNFARIIVAVLSMVIVISSWSLMHEQRGHVLNYGDIAGKISGSLHLADLGIVEVDDGVPKTTDATGIWTERSNKRKTIAHAGLMYAVWRITIGLFFAADILIIISASQGFSWFGHGP
jgi:hypothetical protein